MSYVGLNGSVVRQDQAAVSVMDHGLLYGMGLFETFRTYNGVPFLLEWHLKRLSDSCRLLGIHHQPDPVMITGWLQQLMAANGLSEAYVRYTVTAGEAPLGLPSGQYTAPATLLFAKALPPLKAALYTEGRALQLLSVTRNSPETPVRLKSLHYMNNVMAKRELDERNAATGTQAEGLMLTADGHVAEGIVSNVFFVKGNKLYTPEISTGVLPGITRAVVLELAEELGVEAEEGRYRWGALAGADEVFTTGSVQEIVPVTKLIDVEGASHRIGDGLAGPLTGKLLQAYRKKAGLYRHENNHL